jgi:hypothetical protein
MLEKFKVLSGKSSVRPIFIIGTGRSGTNWVGNTLAVHPQIRATIEAQPMVGWSVALALNPSLKWKHLPRYALFVGIEHNPFSTVASMLKYEAVLGWCVHWKNFPVPNRFWGILN